MINTRFRPTSRVRLLVIALAIITTSYTFSIFISSTPASGSGSSAITRNSQGQQQQQQKELDLKSTTPAVDQPLLAEKQQEQESSSTSSSFWGNAWLPSWSSGSGSGSDYRAQDGLYSASEAAVSTAEDSVIPQPIIQRENATFVTLCRNSELWQIITSIKRVEDRFNKQYKYDWVFLNDEEFTQDFKDLTSALISGEAKYGLIPKEHWSYPDFIDQEKAKESRAALAKQGIIYADSESYRHMCRFNSGFFFHHEILNNYKYYWRVEPDINFFCDIDRDLFKVMREKKKKYGFVISIHEFEKTIPTLWASTKEFLNNRPDALANNNMMDFISDNNGETYNLCHFWSNFEIGDMDFWRSQLYMDYFNHLDKAGGFFYERWGDAPVHSIAAALFLSKDEIEFFDNLGYQHSVYTMCPISKELRMNKKCYCDPNSDFTFRGYSCGKKYYDVMNLTKPENWEKYT